MKKIISSVLFLCFVSVSSATETIPRDFYINNTDVIAKGSVFAENVLPNALLVRICEGERYELYADLLPKNTTEKRLVWRVCEGEDAVSVSLKDNKCILKGEEAGNARISVTAPGGATANVAVEVKPLPKPPAETEGFLIPELPKPQEFNGDMARGVTRALVISALCLFAFAAALWAHGRKKREKR